MVSLKKTIHQHYHWVVAIIVFVEMIVYGGFINSMSVYLIPVSESLGISRGTYSLQMLLQNLSATFGTLIMAASFRRFGFRKSMIAATVLTTVSCLIAAAAPNVYIFGIGRLVMGLGYGVCLTAGATRIVNVWFHKHHGLVLGVITMGTGIGGSLFTTLLTSIIQSMNWRWAFLISGIIQGVVVLLCFLLRNAPEDMGLKPYGDDLNHAKPHAKERNKKLWPGISVKETQRHPAYWMMVAFIALSCIGLSMASSVIVPHFQDNGYSVTAAAQLQSLYMILLAVMKVLAGWISEKIGGKALAVGCMVCGAISLWCLSDVSNPVLGYASVILLSIGITMTTITITMLSEAVFGFQTGIAVTGLLFSMVNVSSMLSLPIGNYCFDALGSYNPVFRVVAVVEAGLIGLLFVIFWMFGKKEKAYWQANPQ